MHRPIVLILLGGYWTASLCGQSNVCESGILYASRIVSESQFLPLEMQGFFEYMPPADPDEVPRKYLVERWSGVRQVHHVHSGGSFTQHLAFSGEWRFDAQTSEDTTTKTIEYLIHRFATGEDETGSCANLRTGINGLPGGGCADNSCGDFIVEPTTRGYTPSPAYESCSNGFGYFWTSEDTVSEELLELDTEENAMIRAEANATIGSSNHAYANDLERNWDHHDRTRPVAFHAQKVRFFALFPPTCPGTYTVLYAYRKWAIGSDQPEEPNHFETDSVTFTEWSSRAPGPSSWIEIPLEKGMNIEIVDAAIFSSCDSTSAGTVEAHLSSVDLSISLGGDAAGNPFGVLILRSPVVTSKLAQPGALQFWNPDPAAVEVVRDDEGIIKSIRAPNRLVTVTAVSPTICRLDHFMGNPETPDPNTPPDITQEITYVDWADDRILRISEQAFGKTTVQEYRDSKTSDRIDLVTGDGLRREALERSASDDGIITERRTTTDDSDNLASQTLDRYHEFPWGRSLIESVLDPEGAALTATFSYYDDSKSDGSGYGQLRERTDPTGHWLRYEYDSEGRISRLTETFLNAPKDAAPDELFERVFSYTTIPDQDADGIEETLETVESRLLDRSIGRRFTIELTAAVTFDGKSTTETWESVATDPEADWNESSNLKTVRRTIAEGALRDRIAQTWRPDGSAVFIRYEALDDRVTIITENGVESDEESRLQRGTINTRVTDRDGHPISEETRDIETDLLIDQKFTTVTDGRGRPNRIEYLDGSYETFAYDCCGQSAGIDRNGLSFENEYDALGRVIAHTTGGIRYEYSYDADGRLIERRRVDPESGTDTISSFTFDLAGRLRSETNELGGTRLISYSELPDGSQVETITHPNGSETRVVRARDGRPLMMDGDREPPRRYTYGVGENGFYTREIFVGDDGAETEWSETTSDFAARPYLIVFADGSRKSRSYDSQGNLVSLTDRDGILHLFDNDPAGFYSIQAIDMNGNGTVDLDGMDQVTRTTRELIIEDEEPIERTTIERWMGEDSDEAETFHLSDRWLTRRAQRESQGALAVRTEAKSLPNGDLEITTSRTEEPTNKTTYRDGRPILKETINDEPGTLRTTIFVHDFFGRLIEQNDSETGSVGFEYDDADRIKALIEQPAPGSEVSLPRRTSYSHDDEGRITEIVRPDGTIETRDYSEQGWLLNVTAPRQPATTYGYDTHGRRIQMGTLFADTEDEAITSWAFDAESGALRSKTTPDAASTLSANTPAGRPATLTGPTGVESNFRYSAAGNLDSIRYSDATPPITFQRDRAGRVTTITDSLGAVALAYDSIDQVIREERFLDGTANVRLERTFDPANRLSGLEVAVDDDTITTRYGYDERGRLTDINHQGTRFQYTWDDESRIQTLRVVRDESDGPSIRTNYDAFGQISSLALMSKDTPVGTFFSTDRDLSGRVLNQTIFDDVRWNLEYDEKGWLSRATRVDPEDQDSILNDILYERDASGNVTRRMNEASGLAMTVNNLNQLVSMEIRQGVEINGFAHPEAIVTVNREPVERQGTLFSTIVPVETFDKPAWQVIDVIAVVPEAGPSSEDAVTATTAHRYVPQTPEIFDYDAGGRLIRDGRWDYDWDAEDRLSAMQTREDVFEVIADPGFPQTRLEFAYDSLNRRIRKIVRTRSATDGAWATLSETGFVYDGWKLIAELDLQERSKPIRSYAWGIDLSGTLSGAHGVGGLIAIHDHTSGTTSLPFTDGNGNILALIDAATGETVARYDYEPYGKLLRLSGHGAHANPLRFSSRYHDSETGLINFGRRYYSPETGRWLSRDPLGEDVGPNLYAYADNDPVNRIDPIGEDVYVVTRPLNIGQLSKAAPAAVHVYLAFDNKGITNQATWAAEVQHQNQGSGLIDPNGGNPYNADPSLAQTFSFHPDSVRTKEGSLNRFWTVSTESTYVAYNDTIDVDEFRNNESGPAVMAFKIPISGIEDQLRLYRMAIASRNINNYHPEAFHPELYAFTRFNCGSWARYIVEAAGYTYPLDIRFGGLINGGIGTDNHLGKPLRAMTDVYDGGFESFEFIYSMMEVQYQRSKRLLEENLELVTP